MAHHLLHVLLRYGVYSSHGAPLTEGERLAVRIAVLTLTTALLLWGIIVLIRYYYKEQMVRRRMRWSSSKDSFWDYNNIVETAKQNYIKAQVLLNTNPSAFMNRLSPYAKARLRLFRKQVNAATDLHFPAAYIVCFDDKRNDAEDSVAVYLEIAVKKAGKYREILIMHREGNSWKITEYVKNPTMFMISHSRSIVEKH